MELAIADLTSKVTVGDVPGIDHIRLDTVLFVPEIRLYLAEDSIVWWARMEAEAGTRLAAPFWASAWAGGQAVARYILDNPAIVAGRQVLDVACGSGLVAIAAAKAGARRVVANDIDPYAIAATSLNADLNDVAVHGKLGDLLGGSGGDAEVILVGDLCYDAGIARRVVSFANRAVARGAHVVIGDPGRGHLPADAMEVLASYRVPNDHAFADSELDYTHVLRPRPVERARQWTSRSR